MSTVTHGPQFAKKQVPAWVVVDSRNVHGQARDAFGIGRSVDVTGVAKMFSDFGFDVQDVWVGIATQGKPKGSARYQEALARNGRFAAAVVSHGSGHVLEGRLVERAGKMEEKLVDVLCALQIARLSHDIAAKNRSGVILVMSEDMDLIPAYEFAAELGVVVYACSNSTVDARASYSRWCLLPEASLRAAVGTPSGRHCGSDLRRFIASLFGKPSPVTLNFKVSGYDSKNSEVYLLHNSGLAAKWPNAPAGGYQRGKTLSLSVIGCDFSDGSFPRLLVGTAPSVPWPPSSCVVGKVDSWRTACRVSVKLPGGHSRT